ncbi:MAG: polysaccharide biosynthesis/export family protein [Pyrinomonadaceae bacterium]
MIRIYRSSILVSAIFLGGLSAAGQAVPAGGTVSSNAVSASVPAADAQDDKYRIGYRDKLSVQVFKHPELSQNVSVNANGKITLFKIVEPVVAVCKTEQELARDIEAAYRKDYLRNPEVNVVATEQLSQAVSVIDAVVKPGPIFLNRRVHLLELIAFAGGPSKDAGSRVLVARMGNTSACGRGPADADDKVDLYSFKMTELQEGKQTFLIQPGDIVSVQKADIVFVYGNVIEQGQVEMRQPLTLTQAIASAKGLKPASEKDRVRIIRQKPGTLDREEIVVNLSAVSDGKAPDPYLQPNDIVAVSQDKMMSIINSVGKSFTQGLGGILYRPF